MVKIGLHGYCPEETWRFNHIIQALNNNQDRTYSRTFCLQGTTKPTNLLRTKENLLHLFSTLETEGFKVIYSNLIGVVANVIDDGHRSMYLVCQQVKTDALACFDLSSETETTLEIFAFSCGDAWDCFEKINNLKIFDIEASPSKIKFLFWQADPDDGCDSFINYLECPKLSEIKNNYSRTISEEVERIVNLENMYDHGKIILWHGPAGNGKTTLIRAITRELAVKQNIVPEVIVDPESVFSNPRYLMQLLGNGKTRVENQSTKGIKFRFIIMEDCANLFSIEESRNTQGFSRLLNTADGLIGQGQKLVFLFTANESVEQIDSAILRPGRCLQNLNISNWLFRDAAEWMRQKGAPELISKLKEDISLAEMYALLGNRHIATEKKEHFGF